MHGTGGVGSAIIAARWPRWSPLPPFLKRLEHDAVRRLADDPHRFILDALIRLSGPHLDWVSFDDLHAAVDVDGFEPSGSGPFLRDYLLDLETRMAVEHHSGDDAGDEFRPTTLAIEALLEADEPRYSC